MNRQVEVVVKSWCFSIGCVLTPASNPDPPWARPLYAAAFRIVFMYLSIDCVNCASTSSAMVITSGSSKLKSNRLRLLCNVPNSVTWRIRDSCTTPLNQQLIFQDRAGTGSGSFNGSTTPFGFWIWCQPVSSNTYGNDCTGSVYFYRLGITVGAAGHVASFQQSGDTLAFTVTVSSVPNGSKISNCIFSFSGTPTEGASNTVTLTAKSLQVRALTPRCQFS
jgi:hypothetical protein